MRATGFALAWLATTALPFGPGAMARQSGAGNQRFPGSAVVSVEDSEYLIRIECRERGRPEAGFSTGRTASRAPTRAGARTWSR